MSCCDPCECIATVRVRQLVNAGHSFDLLLDQQPSVRQQDEFWYFGTNRVLRNYGCRWSGIATIAEDTRYEVRVWNSTTRQPLLTLAPLNADGRPLCLHVFSSLSDPHDDYASPPPHQWSVEVIDEGSEVFRIEFRGQHLGYPVPLTLVRAGHEDTDINRDEKLELITFAQPGEPMVYRLTKALDLNDAPLSLQLDTWSGSPFPLTISADATADDIKYAIAPNQSLTMALVDAAAAASAAFYASPDAGSLSLTIATPAFTSADLPDGETVTFSVYQADDDTFAGETLLLGNVLTVTGYQAFGAAATDATQPLNPSNRCLRVKAVCSSGTTLSTYEATLDLIGAQSLPPISADCGRGVFDLYAYSETIGDDSLGPQITWPDLTVWLTFHEVETSPTRIRNDAVDRSFPFGTTDEPALFHSTARVYVWPTDDAATRIDHLYRDVPDDYPHLQPPWFIKDLTGGNAVNPENTLPSVWIEKSFDPFLPNQSLKLQSFVQVTRDAIVLRLFIGPGFSPVYDADTHGRGWYEYRSTEPPDLISPKEYTLTFAGFFTQVAKTDGSLPTMFPDPVQQAGNPWGSNTFGTPLHRAINQAGDPLNLHVTTFRALLTDFGRPGDGESDPTWSTGYTLIADGWNGGATANGNVADLNGSHLLTGEATQTFPNAPNVSYEWRTIAVGDIVDGVSYELINSVPFVPDQASGLQDVYKQVNESRWNPVRQCLVVHVDGQHYYYRPKTRAVVSDDPDELLFEIDPNPPALTWPGSGVVNVTSQPAEITLRVGPALISNHCPECIENQQPTPMAFELTVPGITATDEPISLLRRADTMWAAHVPGVKPHWLPDGDPLLPDPLHDQLWILDGLETLRLYEVPVNGGDRRPVALYRFRPIEHPQPEKRIDDPATDGVDETFLGWQKSSLDCVSERELTLWMFGQGYDPARHLLPSAVGLKPIGQQCVYGSADYDWQHYLNRWESDAGNSDERPPDDFGLPKIDIIRPDSENRTVCLGYDGTDAGIIWIDDIERWRAFATSCSQTELPSVPPDPDNGEPGDIRRISCNTPDPPDPEPSPCRWISYDGVTWEQIDPSPDEACLEGHECREPWFAPQFVGDVANGYCEPVSCLGGDSEWVWLQLTPTFGKWYWQSDTCPDWCDALAPGGAGTHLQVEQGTCWCPTCT